MFFDTQFKISKCMSFIVAGLFIIMGLLGILYPRFFYNVKLITAEKIERNNRIWRRGGTILVILGAAIMFLAFVSK
jgi:hypothetical protein